MDYVVGLLTTLSIYGVLSLTLTMLVGQAGLFSVAHAAFYGIGAYTTAILTTRWAMDAITAAVVGVFLASAIGLIVAVIALRVHEEYLVIATFGLMVIVTGILNNWVDFTGGPMGISGIPRPVLGGITLQSREAFLVAGFTLVILTYIMLRTLVGSAYGRTLRAIRDDEVAALALGKHVAALKISAFVITAAPAAVAGSLYAHAIRFVSPTDFTIHVSILVLTMALVGGRGSLGGALAGTALVLLLPEVLRFLHLPDAVVGPGKQILYGLLLIAVVRLRPQGLLGEPEPQQGD